MFTKSEKSLPAQVSETLKKNKFLSTLLALSVIQFLIFQFIFQIIIVNDDLNKNIKD
jgi:hypothetical protein